MSATSQRPSGRGSDTPNAIGFVPLESHHKPQDRKHCLVWLYGPPLQFPIHHVEKRTHGCNPPPDPCPFCDQGIELQKLTYAPAAFATPASSFNETIHASKPPGLKSPWEPGLLYITMTCEKRPFPRDASIELPTWSEMIGQVLWLERSTKRVIRLLSRYSFKPAGLPMPFELAPAIHHHLYRWRRVAEQYAERQRLTAELLSQTPPPADLQTQPDAPAATLPFRRKDGVA